MHLSVAGVGREVGGDNKRRDMDETPGKGDLVFNCLVSIQPKQLNGRPKDASTHR